MTILETKEHKMPEEVTKQQEAGAPPTDEKRYYNDWLPEVTAREKTEVKEPPWVLKESARMREKKARENTEAGERMHARVEARQAAIKENTLSIYRLNKANRERPIRGYEARDAEARDAEARDAARDLWTPPKKNLISKVIEFLQQPNQEVARLRKFERQNYENEIRINDVTRGLRKGAGFLRGLAAATFGGIAKVSTGTQKRLEPRPAAGGLRGGAPGPI